MKNKLLLFFLVFSNIVLSQENTDFAPIGAKWHFNYAESMLPWYQGFLLIESVSDTIINDVDCRKLVKTIYEYDYENNEVVEPLVIGHEFITQVNDSVLIYRDGKFKKLYDFGAEIGDTLSIPGRSVYNGIEIEPSKQNGYAVVVGKGITELDGKPLKYIDLKQFSDSHWQFLCYVNYGSEYSVRICEKIGNISGYMLPEPFEAISGIDMAWDGGGILRCYSDLETNISFVDQDCDYMVAIEEVTSDLINLYPNPTDGNINIEMTEDYNTIDIYDSLGRIVYSSSVEDSSLSIDISHHPSGLYLIAIKNNTDTHYIKVVKN